MRPRVEHKKRGSVPIDRPRSLSQLARLEGHANRQLQLAREIVHRVNYPEIAARQIRDGRMEYRRIKSVERFRTKLTLKPLSKIEGLED